MLETIAWSDNPHINLRKIGYKSILTYINVLFTKINIERRLIYIF